MSETTTVDPEVTDPGEPDTDAGEGENLFNAAAYDDPDLVLRSPDGQNIDSIVLGIGGQITLDRFDKEHIALIRALHLGQRLEIKITAQADRTGYRQVRHRQRTDTVQHTSLGVGAAIEWRLLDDTGEDGE